MRFGKNFSNLETRKLTTHDLGATVVCVQWSFSYLPVVCPFFIFPAHLVQFWYSLVQFK